MTIYRTSRPRLDFRRVTRETFYVLRRDGGRLIGLALILFCLPATLQALIAADDLFPVARELSRFGKIIAVAVVAFQTAFGVAAVKIALARLSNEHVSTPTLVSAVVAAFPTVFAMSWIVNWSVFNVRVMGVYLGMSPLIADSALVGIGIALTTTFKIVFLGVLTPVVVAETRAPRVALQRCVALMIGGRLPLVLVCYGVWGVVAIINSRPLVRDAMHLAAVDSVEGWYAGEATLASLLNSLGELGLAVFTAAYYRELCRVRDRLTPAAVAEIFG
jgi:hypothetical protein